MEPLTTQLSVPLTHNNDSDKNAVDVCSEFPLRDASSSGWSMVCKYATSYSWLGAKYGG